MQMIEDRQSETEAVLDLAGVARALRLKGKNPEDMARTYLKRARRNRRAGIERAADLPEPDVYMPGRLAWKTSTITSYVEARKTGRWRK